MFRIALIALGGGGGSVLRYLVQGWVQAAAQRLGMRPFPLGTLLVNISGCFAIGFLATLFAGPRMIREDYRFAIITGILGGYTTFSSFSWESNQLANEREFLLASVNVGVSVVVGLIATWLGRELVVSLYGTTA